ncbi:MAG: SprB repeat-containing protein, partial [Bacteroidales bacterium]|nr:SprB repeat-containing protein [Bacteroidales bacterium]
LIWVTLGDGTFNDSSMVNPQYVAGPNDLLNGNVTLIITANGLALNETCTPATDTIEVWFSNPVVTFRARDLLCYNNNSGYIKAVMSGGNEPFVFEWSGPDGYTASADSIFGLAAGEYRVTITDIIGCHVTDTVILTQPEELIAVIDSSENVVCFGGNDGYARVLTTGGTGDYNYSLGTWPPQNTAEAVNLTAGEYIVNVTDENKCFATTIVTITEPPLLVLSADSVDAKCLGSTGSVDLTVTGGTPFANEPYYLYEWSDETGIFATTEDITGLEGNQLYTVVVTDSVGCIDTLSILVNEENDIVLTLENIDSILCYNESTGAIDITVSGGTEPFVYLWNNSSTTQDLNYIPAGDYDVSVTDANGCNQVMSFTLFNPEELIATVTATVNEICENDTIFLNSITSGGTGNHTHLWSGSGAVYLNETGITDPIFNGAPAGSYTLTYSVTDENNCL